MKRDITPKDEVRRLQGLRDQFGFDAFKFRVGAEYGHDKDEWPGRTEEIVPAMRQGLGDAVELLPIPVRKGAGVPNFRRFRELLIARRPDQLVTYNFGAFEWVFSNLGLGIPHAHTEEGFGKDEAHRRMPRRNLTRRAGLLVSSTKILTVSQTLQRIAQSDAELTRLRLEDQQSYGNRPHKANLWTRYTFSSGRLKGLAAGGGWRYQSGNVAGVQVSTERQLIGNARSLGDLFLQYKTKGLAGIWPNSARVTYQLNITNVLDDRTIVATKLDIDSVSNVVFVRRGFREDPRAFAFSLRTDF
jgi:hypothetical protein